MNNQEKAYMYMQEELARSIAIQVYNKFQSIKHNCLIDETEEEKQRDFSKLLNRSTKKISLFLNERH